MLSLRHFDERPCFGFGIREGGRRMSAEPSRVEVSECPRKVDISQLESAYLLHRLEC